MIDIASLRAGDIVRNLVSGNARSVVADAEARYAAKLSDGIECSNPNEWELLAKGPWINGAEMSEAIGGEMSETIGGEYAIEVSVGDRTVRYSAPSAEGVAELMRVDSDHVMGAR